MINFFRHLRQSMISKKGFSKYLLYAIGEIILVVVGILIALQINNWNEVRKNSNKEKVVLGNIHKEFKKNKKQLDSVIDWHVLNLNSCQKIIDHFPIRSKPNKEVLDSLSIYLWDSYGGVTFNPSQSSITGLTSTSSFDIISDEVLRDLLISWNDLITDYQEEELRSRDYLWQQYDPYLSKHFDFKFNFKDERNDFKALESLEFEFLVKSRHDLLDQILYSTKELQKVQQTLQEIINRSDTIAYD